jgi:hypothetical protein
MKIKVVRRKLGKEKADGQAWHSDRLIEIDPRLTPKNELETIIHEATHIVFPEMSEADVTRHGEAVASVLWKEGFRKCRL